MASDLDKPDGLVVIPYGREKEILAPLPIKRIWGVGPRTAIGQRKDGTVLFVVIDGRQPGYSLGATLRDVQDVLYEKGAYIAANLDGGSSSTLYLNGKVVNKPADLLGERMIPTAFIVK